MNPTRTAAEAFPGIGPFPLEKLDNEIPSSGSCAALPLAPRIISTTKPNQRPTITTRSLADVT